MCQIFPAIRLLLKRSRAEAANRSMLIFLVLFETRVAVTVPFGPLTAIHSVPTGLAGVPPLGPAMPEVEMEEVVPSFFLTH